MRILIVASWYRSARAPVRGSFIREQALALARRGHNVQVVFVDPDARRPPLSVRRAQDGLLHELAIAAPWPLHRVLGFYLPWPLVRCVRNVIREVRPDVVHAHAARPAGVIATTAAQSLDVPVVLTEHKADLSSFWFSRHGWAQVRCAYESCTRLYAVSAGLKKRAECCFPSTQGRWIVNPNGVDTELFRVDQHRCPAGTRRERKILFLGGLLKRKGLATLLEALRRMPEHYVLAVAGPDASAQRLLPMAARYGLSERVRALGLVDRSAVVKLLNEHDVLAVPSEHETFGLVCAEALACGTPVVATRCGGPEEVVREPFGMIVEPGDHWRLAEAIERVLDLRSAWNPEQAHQYIHENFSMESLAARLERQYASLIH